MKRRLLALLVCAGGAFSAGPAWACTYARPTVGFHLITIAVFIVGALLFAYLVKKVRFANSGDLEFKLPSRIGLLCLFMVALIMVAGSGASLFIYHFMAEDPCAVGVQPTVINDAGPVAPIAPLDEAPTTGPIPLVP